MELENDFGLTPKQAIKEKISIMQEKLEGDLSQEE
jgi:hypothetical protein